MIVVDRAGDGPRNNAMSRSIPEANSTLAFDLADDCDILNVDMLVSVLVSP